MKRIILLLSLCLPISVYATRIHEITAQTTRMSEDTLKKRFHLKPGDLFTTQAYEKAQEDLHKFQRFKYA